MDPVTLATGVELAAAAIKVISDYSTGAITQEQAHQRLVDASVSVLGAIAMFNRAAPPPSTPAAG